MKSIAGMAISGTGMLDDAIDRSIASCLLYGYLESVAKEESDGLSDTAKEYAKQYAGAIATLRSQYVSYAIMREKMKSFGSPAFVTMSDPQIETILSLYEDKTKIANFSVIEFSQKMYSVVGLSWDQLSDLRRRHYSYFVPIARYYADNYGTLISDMHIASCVGFPNNPGKELIFWITGIPSSKIAADIMAGSISCGWTEVTLLGDYVRIMVEK